MTIPHLLQGLSAGLNMGPDFTVAVGGAGLLASPDPLAGSFDLNQLDKHNFPIECVPFPPLPNLIQSTTTP